MKWFAGLIFLFFSVAAFADVDKTRLMTEACGLVSQQRNAFADAAAVAEARHKLVQEQVDQWEAYFRAYVGEAKS